jgi:hypothetical protein
VNNGKDESRQNVQQARRRCSKQEEDAAGEKKVQRARRRIAEGFSL